MFILIEHYKLKMACGGYSKLKLPTEDSKTVITNIFADVKVLHESLNDLELTHLLENHMFSTQVVAGLNYVFVFTHKNTDYKVTTWAKLDKTYQSRLTDMKSREVNEVD